MHNELIGKQTWPNYGQIVVPSSYPLNQCASSCGREHQLKRNRREPGLQDSVTALLEKPRKGIQSEQMDVSSVQYTPGAVLETA